MPHIHIEYSANLETLVDMAALCEKIRRAAAQIDALPMPGIRVRAVRVDHVAIADGQAKHGFVDLTLRLREGREQAVKEDAIGRIFAALKAAMAPAMAHHSIALSAELREINAALAPKFGNIRDHLEGSV
ncbi:MAG: 5-carboxymethyl-2-hydroxymuconate isomerase [Pseudomonadota bacterium]